MTPPALWTLVGMASCAGWTIAMATEGIPPVYLALVAGLAVVEMEAFRRIDAVRVRLMATGELAGLVVIAVGCYHLVSLFIPAGVSSEVVGTIAAFLVWLLASITVTDLEAVVEPTDLVGGLSGPAGRLAGRMLLVGLGLTIAVVLANGPLAPVAEPRPIRAGLVFPYLVYWVLGVAGLAGIQRSKNIATWQRDQAQIDSDLRSRWSGATSLWLVVAGVVAAVLSWPGRFLVAGAHAVTTNAVSVITGWITALLHPDRPRPRNQVLPSVDATLPEAVDPGSLIAQAPSWWEAVLLLAAGLIFAFAFTLLTRRSRRTGGGSIGKRLSLSTVASLFAAIGALLSTLWQALLGLRRRRGQVSIERERAAPSSHPMPWVPADEIRRRIATDYRTFVRAATNEIGSPLTSETPAEYARRVSGTLDQEPAVDQLSDLYTEARFSVHRLSDDDASRAEEWRERIVERLVESTQASSDPSSYQ